MAPEIILGKKYQSREADLFALGVILYTMYAALPPFMSAEKND
jgi:serine/threonine protein kinase